MTVCGVVPSASVAPSVPVAAAHSSGDPPSLLVKNSRPPACARSRPQVSAGAGVDPSGVRSASKLAIRSRCPTWIRDPSGSTAMPETRSSVCRCARSSPSKS
jgi:hypothetical protein